MRFLLFFSNFNQIESAAFVEICCPTIVRHNEKNGSSLVVKNPLLNFFIIFFNTGSLLDNIFFCFIPINWGFAHCCLGIITDFLSACSLVKIIREEITISNAPNIVHVDGIS